MTPPPERPRRDAGQALAVPERTKDFSGLKKTFSGEFLCDEASVLAYAYDAAPERGRPDGVAIARSAEDVQAIVRWCVKNSVPYIARGAGTNLSGGCVALRGGIILSLVKMDRILSIDTRENVAMVEPGAVNLRLQTALGKVGRFYAPDPASYRVCTLGGNVGENAGGPRCLKYGVTTNHVRGLEVVMPDGTPARFMADDAGSELMSLIVGSEGTLGVVTKIWLGILPLPEKILTALVSFPSLGAAMACVSGIIAAGVVPRVLEAMDRTTVESIEAYVHAGYPDAEAVLLIEVEGEEKKAVRELEKVRGLCEKHGAETFRVAKDAAAAEKLWEGRRSAYAALARLAPNVMVEDGVVPRSRLAEAVRRIREIAAEYKLRPAFLFHAGDGNLHPNVVYDERDEAQTERVRRGGAEILKACVELGGSISGEHGIGVEKRAAMSWLFSPETLELFRRIKRVVDPRELANPDKLFPPPDPGARSVRPRRPGLTDPARSLVERVREKAEAGEPLTVIGGGSKTPKDIRTRIQEVLTTRPLSTLRELDKANYTLTAEAGISLSELKSQVESQGIYVPVPLLRGTLGGLCAAKAFPGIRDHVLAMRLLLVDGTVVDVGAPVVKSVAGYDVPRLLLGSWGTLAVILEVSLKVYPYRGDYPSDLPAPARPAFGEWHLRLKKAFDPGGRLNRWVAATDDA